MTTFAAFCTNSNFHVMRLSFSKSPGNIRCFVQILLELFVRNIATTLHTFCTFGSDLSLRGKKWDGRLAESVS